MLYHYWLLRYVPDTSRPDTVGVGLVVLGQDPTEVAVEVVRRYDEIPDIGGPRKEFMLILRDFERELVSYTLRQEGFSIAHTSSARSFIERLRRQNHGVLRIDAPIPASGESAQWLCDFLFDRLVTRRQPDSRETNRVAQIRNIAKKQYKQSPVITEHLFERPLIQLDKGSTKSDLAILTDSYQEINRAFSFAVRPTGSLRDRGLAFAHYIGKLRSQGAKVQAKNREYHLMPDSTAVVALTEYPQTKSQIDIFKEATADWNDLGIDLLEPSQLPSHLMETEHKLAS